MRINFTLNGKPVTIDVEPNEILLDVLRYKLGLISVKRGCERAECGTCTVLLDDKPVYSCMLLAPQVDGKDVKTLEYVRETREGKIIIEKMVQEGGVQCGFCTPGFIVTSYALLKEKKKPDINEIKKALEGNICRCTGYVKIFRAVEKASDEI